jgi:hypothetical protein
MAISERLLLSPSFFEVEDIENCLLLSNTELHKFAFSWDTQFIFAFQNKRYHTVFS